MPDGTFCLAFQASLLTLGRVQASLALLSLNRSLAIDIVELTEILQRTADGLRQFPLTHILPEAFHAPLNTRLHLERQDVCFMGQDIIHLGGGIPCLALPVEQVV